MEGQSPTPTVGNALVSALGYCGVAVACTAAGHAVGHLSVFPNAQEWRIFLLFFLLLFPAYVSRATLYELKGSPTIWGASAQPVLVEAPESSTSCRSPHPRRRPRCFDSGLGGPRQWHGIRNRSHCRVNTANIFHREPTPVNRQTLSDGCLIADGRSLLILERITMMGPR